MQLAQQNLLLFIQFLALFLELEIAFRFHLVALGRLLLAGARYVLLKRLLARQRGYLPMQLILLFQAVRIVVRSSHPLLELLLELESGPVQPRIQLARRPLDFLRVPSGIRLFDSIKFAIVGLQSIPLVHFRDLLATHVKLGSSTLASRGDFLILVMAIVVFMKA